MSATHTDWMDRAEVAAHGVLNDVGLAFTDTPVTPTMLRKLLAIAWLEGHKAGCQETLDDSRAALDRLVESLS
jgi:hypothetical protein